MSYSGVGRISMVVFKVIQSHGNFDVLEYKPVGSAPTSEKLQCGV